MIPDLPQNASSPSYFPQMLSPKAYISGKIPNLVAFPVSYQRYLWKSLGTSAEKKKRTRERETATLEQIVRESSFISFVEIEIRGALTDTYDN
jgi:hypothetical protein